MIDDAIDRLIAAFDDAGLPPVRPAAADIEAVLERIAAEVAPLRVPEQLLAFWRRIDVSSLVICPHPDLADPSFALHSWREIVRDRSGVPVPRVMFPLCYESWSFRWIELEDGQGHGGGIFDWGFAGSPYRLDHVDMVAFLDQFASMVELGEVVTALHEGQPWHQFDPDDVWDDITSVRLSGAPATLGYDRRELDEDVRSWPQHWLASSQITTADSTARGATTTIAALLAEASPGTESAGTVHALVTSLGMTVGGCQIVVDDGTESVDVWCPDGLSPYGPIVRTRFELDLVVHGARVARPDTGGLHCEIVRSALGGDMAAAQEAAKEYIQRTSGIPCTATAIGLRPLD